MVILINPRKCHWLDSKHTVFVCPVKDPAKGWVNITCHQHSDGVAKTVWEYRRYIDIPPYEMEHANDIHSE